MIPLVGNREASEGFQNGRHLGGETKIRLVFVAMALAEEMAKQIVNDVEDNSLKDVVVKTSTGKVIHTARIKPDSD